MAEKGISEIRSLGVDFTVNDPNVADEFNPERATPYQIGEYAYYKGKLWRFTAVHSGSWSNNDATMVELAEELTAEKADRIAAVGAEQTARINADNAERIAREDGIHDSSRTAEEANRAIGNEKQFITIEAVAGWANKTYFFAEKAFKKDVYYYFTINFDPQVSDSAYLFLFNDVSDVEILNRQVQGLSTVSFSWKPTVDVDSVSCFMNTESYAGKCDMTLSTSNADKVTENEIALRGISSGDKYVSLFRFDPFMRGGNYFDNYYDYAYMVSSKGIITAEDDWFLQFDGIRVSLTLFEDGEITTYIDWKTKNYYLPKGTEFIIRITANPNDTSVTADINDLVGRVKIYNAGKYDWNLANDYCDALENGKWITTSGEKATASGNYYQLRTFLNPTFRRIKAHISNQGTSLLEISFFTDETIIPANLDSDHSIGLESGWTASIQAHYLYADVPEGCKAVCVCSRTLLNDDTPFTPEIYVDDLSAYELKAVQQKAYSVPMFNDYKYICHLFAERIGSGNYYIPCESMAYIDIAHRLGYRAIELNVHQTATPGKYVCIHGTGGMIGDELVDPNGTDISGMRFENVDYATFRDVYVYNTTEAKYRTHVTFLDEALQLCKKYCMIPLVSWAGYDLFDEVRKYVGDNFAMLVYNEYYLQRRIFKGMYNIYASDEMTVEQLDALCKQVGTPLMIGLGDTVVENMTKAQLRALADVVHSNGCLIGSAGVYQDAATNLKLDELGFDFNATGNGVEYFESGNIVDLHDDNTFTAFETNGTVSGGVLSLADGNTIASDEDEQYFLSKAILQIRFAGKVKISMGHYIQNLTVESDGLNDVELSTFFVNSTPNFSVVSVGNTSVYSCNYKASAC